MPLGEIEDDLVGELSHGWSASMLLQKHLDIFESVNNFVIKIIVILMETTDLVVVVVECIYEPYVFSHSVATSSTEFIS